MKRVAPDETGLQAAVDAVRADGVVLYPTETVYGLGVNPFSPAALCRLREVKGRDADNPILVIVSGVEQLEMLVAPLSPLAAACVEAFWPGALTLLLPPQRALPRELTSGRPKLAVRWPAHPVARAFCEHAGIPLTSTSANRSGEAPAMHVDEVALADIDVCIDGGVLAPSLPSTIYDPDERRIVRHGAVSAEILQRLAERD